jgi:hypothetical protein
LGYRPPLPYPWKVSEHEQPVPRSGDDTDPVPDAANLGPVRPPLVYLGSILLGLLLHFAWPLPLVRHPVGALIGAGVVLLAVGLFVTAVRTFRAASTPVPGNRPTTTIVRTGTYRLSRNPIYLGVLGSPGRPRPLRGQPVVAHHARSGVGAHVLMGHPQRGALPRSSILLRVPVLQGLGAPVVVGGLPAFIGECDRPALAEGSEGGLSTSYLRSHSPLFARVRGRGVLRTSPVRNSTKFITWGMHRAFSAISRVGVPWLVKDVPSDRCGVLPASGRVRPG